MYNSFASSRQEKYEMKKKLLEKEAVEIGNYNYCQSRKARNTMKEIIEELKTMSDVTLIANRYSESIKMNGRIIGTIWPLKDGWSGSVGHEKITRWDSAERYLTAIKIEIESTRKAKPNLKPSTSRKQKKDTQNDAEVIAKLKERIGKMSKDSKGISVKGIKITKAIKQFCKNNGYSLSGETLLINRIE